jgi:hypothetical protein
MLVSWDFVDTANFMQPNWPSDWEVWDAFGAPGGDAEPT